MKRIIDVTTARRQFGSLLDEVYYKGDIITIERKGKPLAQIVPCASAGKDNALSSQQLELIEELHGLPTMATDQDPTAVLRKMRRQKRTRANKTYGK